MVVGGGAPEGTREWRKAIFESDRYTFQHLFDDQKLMQMYLKMMTTTRGILKDGKVVLRPGEAVPRSSYTRNKNYSYLKTGACFACFKTRVLFDIKTCFLRVLKRVFCSISKRVFYVFQNVCFVR